MECAGAFLSPSTGIVDVHEYMLALEGDAEAAGAVVAFGSPCLGGAVRDDRIRIDTGGAEPVSLVSDVVVNAAALGAQDVARGIEGLDPRHVPPLHYAKGNYFCLTGRSPFSHLVYPMPSDAWLGVHVGLDLGHRCRFGPDLHWVDTLDYDVDASQAENFYASIRRYYPALRDGALQPDYTGIRPKIHGPGETAPDFVIQGAETHGIDGLVNLFGIESPGLTSSLAIAEEVAERVSPAPGRAPHREAPPDAALHGVAAHRFDLEAPYFVQQGRAARLVHETVEPLDVDERGAAFSGGRPSLTRASPCSRGAVPRSGAGGGGTPPGSRRGCS